MSTDATPVPLLDPEMCAQLAMLERSSPGFLRRLVGGFLVRQSRAIADAELQLQRQDLVALGATAHTLKGSSSSLGATALASLAGELEFAARNNDGQRCQALLEALRPTFDAAERALNAWINE